MSPRRFKPFKPFKNSKKSPFDHDGPSQKALKDALDWIASHDPNTPFSQLIQEIRKPVPPLPDQPPVLVPDESVESATTSVEVAAPESERAKQEESAHREEELLGAPPSVPNPRDDGGSSSEYDEESEEVAAQIRSLLRPPQRPPINSRRIRRIDDDDPANLSRHRRLCVICHHEDRYAIEQAFLEWRRPSDIKREFHLVDHSNIYRHARATGLFEKRARNLRFALEKVMEESTARPPSADSIIRAVRVYGCLDANGRWAEPPRNLIITHHTRREPQPEPALPDHVNDGPATPAKRLISVDPTIIETEKGA